nr:DUF2726 domain-containing protein [Solimonas marina]
MLIVAIVLAIIIVIAAQRLRRRDDAAVDDARYVTKPVLLSAAERAFLSALESAVAGQYRIFAMVRVADVLSVEAVSRGRWQSAFNRINAKHFDFVICEHAELSPRIAIELNDGSHRRADRRRRDDFLRNACQQAGLPLLEVPVSSRYRADVLRRQLQALIDFAPGDARRPARIEPRIEPTPNVPVVADRPAAAPEPDVTTLLVAAGATVAAEPRCPKCDGEVQRRRIDTGRLAGREFWLCRAFPVCAGMLPVAADTAP